MIPPICVLENHRIDEKLRENPMNVSETLALEEILAPGIISRNPINGKAVRMKSLIYFNIHSRFCFFLMNLL